MKDKVSEKKIVRTFVTISLQSLPPGGQGDDPVTRQFVLGVLEYSPSAAQLLHEGAGGEGTAVSAGTTHEHCTLVRQGVRVHSKLGHIGPKVGQICNF